ncbi:hypothetical protein [Streptomyces sp. NPDC089919]|uniref:hypothetical protein n=1 Tax=Streptomyces sp. NPDC089919 TaxID=3155188 RepID=UPI003435F572
MTTSGNDLHTGGGARAARPRTAPGRARPWPAGPRPTGPAAVRPPARVRGGPGGTAPDRTAARQLNLLTQRQLTRAGVSAAAVARRSRPGGPWQRLLPRVYLLQTGPPDARQHALAAVLYAARPGPADPLSGATAVLTGGAALALFGIRGAPAEPLDVLVPAPRTVAPAGAVRPLTTSRWPATITVGGIPVTRPVRAAADFARRTDDPDRVRAVLAGVVQSGWCHPQDLYAELRAGRLLKRPGAAAAAAELVAGVRSVAEGRARDTLAGSGLPQPLWNPRLVTPEGTFLATPDAYWPEEGVALEVDSAEYHYSRDSWHATLRRRLLLESHGVLVVSATPAMLRDTPGLVLAALRTLLTRGPTPPRVRTLGDHQLALPF